MSNLTRKIKKKLSVVEIRNLDNMCLIRATLVALASTCRVHLTQFQRLKALYPTYDTGEILIHFATCPTWYYIELRQNSSGFANTSSLRDFGYCHKSGPDVCLYSSIRRFFKCQHIRR